MAWNDGLTGIQLNIAAYPGSPLRVIAGPGTGKTFSLMRRVVRFLETGENPRNILTISFTRTAAYDLLDKLRQLNVPGAEHVNAKTLHSLCFQLLKRNDVFAATDRIPRPLMVHEVSALICDLKDEFGGKRATQNLISCFESYWATLQSSVPGWPTDQDERKFHNRLISWLRFHGAILLGELVPLTYDFIRDNPTSPDIPHFTHVLVDEYQDLNRADQCLIDLLSTNGALTIIGDEDQSIYSFRHAHPEGINEFANGHPQTHDEILDECRRCPQHVVMLASNLISNNNRARITALRPRTQNTQGQVYIVAHDTIDDEVEMLSAYVAHYLSTHPDMPAGQVIVLASRRAIGYQVRDALNTIAANSQAAWQAKSFFYEEALDGMSARRGFILLSLLCNPEDRPSLRAWFFLDDSTNGKAGAYAKLRAHCEQTGQSPREGLDKLSDGTIQIPYTTPLIDLYRQLKAELQALTGLKIPAIVDRLFPATDRTCADIRQMAITAATTAQNYQELLDEIITLTSQPELPGDTDQVVRVMSLHKSKGLTAQLVVVAGCVQGAIPTIKIHATPEKQRRMMEEQRRLFYVAMTRTTDALVLSHAARMSFADAMQMGVTVIRRRGPHAILQASSFLAQLGAHRPHTIRGQDWRNTLGF